MINFIIFEDFRKAAMEIENEFGKSNVVDYYNAIIDYALHEKEPKMQGVIKYLWHTTKATTDKSIERGYSRVNKETANESSIESLSEKDRDRITEYLEVNTNEISGILAYIGCDASYFLEWLDRHGYSFSINGCHWEHYQDCYKSYIDFVKLGVEANPLSARKEEAFY